MSKTAVSFGRENHLVGVIHNPEIASQVSVPGVVLLNAGIDHRVGPRRIYVAIAAWLANSGYPSIRFDYSGLGESAKPATPISADSIQETLTESVAAADVLHEHTQCQEFIVCGLCSGADDAHRLAVHDDRVTGVILIDGYAYPNWRFHVMYYLQRIFSLRRWRNFIERLLARIRLVNAWQADDGALEGQEQIYFFAMPRREQLVSDLRKLIERGVKLLYVYSGETGDCYNYESQFRDNFPEIDFGDSLTEHYIPRADHTFSRTEDRMDLLNRIGAWLPNMLKSGRRQV